MAVVALANIVLWLLARPNGQPTGRFIGELCGAEAVLLFSCSLVLATLLAPIERAFGGATPSEMSRSLASCGLARSTGGSTAVSTSITRLPTPMTRSISTKFVP
ncbi:MAG: hypothetical protein ACLQA5_00610 [Solirubrobacteraceae bacterium]